MKFIARLVLAYILSLTLTLAPVAVNHAQAGMISTSAVVDNLSRQDHEQNVSEFLTRTDVKEQMTRLGLTPDEAQRRISSLSDREIKKLSGEVDHAVAGGSVAGVLIVVILVLLIIYLVKRV